jgi:hypothetical protein
MDDGGFDESENGVYEDDLEAFELNQLAADRAAEGGEDEERDDGELPTQEQIVEQLAREFVLLGHSAPGRGALERMALVLAQQQVDFGDIGITACALGWLAHAAAVREL